MSYLTPPLPCSPPSPWNRKNKPAPDRSSASDSDHEDAAPQPINIDPGKKKIFGVSLSISAPQPALRKIKYKVDKKDGSKDKITAKQLLLNSRLSATVAAIEEEKKKDSIIADLSQQRASEIAQSIQEKRDKEEKWKYGGRGRHRTYKKIWTPHPRSKHKRPRGSKSKSRSRSASRGRKEKKRSESPKRELLFKDWASWNAASSADHDEYRRKMERQERKLEKNASKGKLPRSMDEIKPVFDLTDAVIRPRSLLAYPREGSALVSYPLINVHFTDAQPTVKWSPHPKADKVFYPARKIFTAHANREQLELFSFIADSRTRRNQSDDVPKTERPWYPADSFPDLTTDKHYDVDPNVDPKNVTIIVESVDEKVAAAKKAIMDFKQSLLNTKEEEVKPPMPPPFLSSFRPVVGSPEAKPEEPKNAEEPQGQLVTEYEAFLKMVSDKDNEARNNDWDSDSDMDEPRDVQRARQEAPEAVDPGEMTVSDDVTMQGNDLVNEAIPPAESSIADENESQPGKETQTNVIPVVKELLLNVDTLGREFQETFDEPEKKEEVEPAKKSPKKIKKKKGKKAVKKSKKKHASSSSDSESSDSSSESGESTKKRKKGKKKVKKLKKKAVASSSTSSDSEIDSKRKKKKKTKKSDKGQDIAEKLLIDLQMKKQEVLQKLRDLEHVSDKKVRKALSKSLEEETAKINQLELLILGKSKKKDRKRKKSRNESSSSDSDSEDDKKKLKKKNKKRKAKKKASSSSESSEDKSKKKKHLKKAKAKKEKKTELHVDPKNDENSVEPVKATRKRPAEEDIAPVTPKTMFMDFASSGWIGLTRGNDAPVPSRGAEESTKPPGEDAGMKAPQPRSVRDVTNTIKDAGVTDNRTARKNEWEASSSDVPLQAGAFQAVTAQSDAVKKGIAEFRAFQAISALQPPGTDNSLPASTRDLYSPGASESEASRSLASPLVTSSLKRKFQSAPLEPSQVVCSDSQTSTSFFNVASAEESREVKQPIRLGNPNLYGEDDLVPPGEEPCILDMPPQPLKYSYETGGLLLSSDSRGSDMSVDDDAAGRRIKSKIKSLKLQKKMKKKPSAFVSPVKYIRDNFLSDNDIPEESSQSPSKKQPKAPMTVESVFYQDSDSDEEDMRPPRLDFSSIFAQGSQEEYSYDDKKDDTKPQSDGKKDDDFEKSLKNDDKGNRSKDRRKSSSPRRSRRSSRSPDRRGSRRSAERRDSKRFSRSPERRRRRSPSPKRRHRSPSPPRRRHKDRRSRSRSRSHSPRNKRSKRRSRSRSPRRGESPRKRNLHASDYHGEDVAGRIPVLGTTIPAPMPGSIFSGEDKPPNGTDHRLSLDQRIELELGVKLRNTPPPSELHASCYYPPYNVSHYPYAPGGVVQVGNMMEMMPSASTQRPNSSNQTNIVQVGNVLQVVPLARATAVVAPTPVAPEPPVVDASQNPLIKAIQAERERRRKEKEARKAERDERRKARQAKRDAKHLSIAEKLKLSNSLIADLIDMKAERNEGLVLGHDMEDEELLLEALDPPSPQGPLEIIQEGNSSTTVKSILITPGQNSIKETTAKKNVKFADGLLPGDESESESEGVEKPLPKPKLPKEKRFKKKLKKKIKVQVVRHAVEEPPEEEDDLPPPSPPPGDPPPIMYASFPFGGQVQYPVYQIGATVKSSLPALK